MSRYIGIAGLQLIRDPADVRKNIVRFTEVAKSAKLDFPWVDLIFTGEYYLAEYKSGESWGAHAKEIPNEITDEMSEVAKELETWIVPGTILERDGNKVYNTALVYNRNGDIVAKYRKMFPWLPRENYDSGTDFVVFDFENIGKIGLAICYDIWIPEVIRTLTWMGAEIILQPTAATLPDRDTELILTRANAIFNQVYVFGINTIYPQGGGQSILTDPEGRVLRQVGRHEEIMAEAIDLEKVSWLRQHGTSGNTPVWKSLRDSPINGKFPIYENLQKGEVFKNLGSLKVQDSVREWTE